MFFSRISASSTSCANKKDGDDHYGHYQAIIYPNRHPNRPGTTNTRQRSPAWPSRCSLTDRPTRQQRTQHPPRVTFREVLREHSCSALPTHIALLLQRLDPRL